MSAPRLELRFTPHAPEDLEDILLYSEISWGQRQADHYESLLAKAFEALSFHPHLGRNRDNVPSGTCSRLVESHNIYYHIMDNVIEVIRNLHHRVEPEGHL